MQATNNLAEAERLMTICNACRYCEGLCAVFPAMEMRRSFSSGDLTYLANLCHGCGACYVDCQFAPPHEFDVNVPRVMAQVRNDSYRNYAWPSFLQPIFDRNGLAIAIATALSVAAFILGFVLWHDPDALFTDAGNFYRLMPHNVMVAIFGSAAIFAVVALTMGFRAYWRDIGGLQPNGGKAHPFLQATRDAGSLRYLDGGGVGCYNEDERPVDNRRLFHHLTFYGFLLCFAATTAGTFYHYFLDMPAPYPWYQLPKLLGIAGGIGLSIGPVGLLKAKFTRDPDLVDTSRLGMDTAFTLMLFLTGVTGLLLMLLRMTPAMGLMLALHLGVVLALFLTLPYGKFVHGIYRFGALARYAVERRAIGGSPATATRR